jgi:hypothetical protein
LNFDCFWVSITDISTDYYWVTSSHINHISTFANVNQELTGVATLYPNLVALYDLSGNADELTHIIEDDTISGFVAKGGGPYLQEVL